MGGTGAILRRYAFVMWRKRWIAVGTAWLICLVGWFAVMRLPNIYEADAEVAVAPESVLAPFLQGIAIGDNTGAEVALVQQTLLTRPVLATLIAKENLLGGRDTPQARAALEGELARAIRIVPETDPSQNPQMGSVFAVAYRDWDPERAYAVVKGLLSTFVDLTVGSKRTDLTAAQRFLDGQIVSDSRQLHELEQRRAALVAKYAPLLPGDKETPSQFDRVRANVQSLETRLQDTNVQVSVLQHELASASQTLEAGPSSANAQALAAEERYLAALRLRFTDAYPGVIQARKLVAALASGKGLTAPAGQPVANPVYDQLKVQLIDAQASELQVQRQLEAATAERDRLAALAKANPNLLAEYSNLDGTYQMVRKQYGDLLSRRASMQITAAATANAYPLRVNIVNPPQLPVIPVAPPRKLFLAGVLLVGLGSCAGVAFALAYADNRCYTMRELEDIGVPVIGGVSLRQVPPLHRRTLPFLAFGVALFLLIVACAGVISIGQHLGWRA